jgi:hypothetical protein
MPYKVVATIRRQLRQKAKRDTRHRPDFCGRILVHSSRHGYLPAPAAIFLTIAITSLRSLSFKLGE